MPISTSAHCIVFLPETENIFLTGGINRDLGTGSRRSLAFMYDKETQTWLPKADMLKARSNHACELFKNKVWVGGSWESDVSVEIYSIEQNSWQFGPDLPYSSRQPGEFVVDGESLYYAGGWDSRDIFKLNEDGTGWQFVRMSNCF